MDHDIGRDDIEAASRRIASDIRRTPLLRIDGGQLGIDGVELWLKLEHLQVGGSFKARGMFNRMRSNAIPAAGVVIASGGNAGIAVACAAKALAVRCEVFVPESSSRAKRDKLAALGADRQRRRRELRRCPRRQPRAPGRERRAPDARLRSARGRDRRGDARRRGRGRRRRSRSRAGQRRRRRPDRRRLRLVRRALRDRCARARACADPAPGPRGGPAGRRRGVGNRRRFARRAPHRRDRVAR